MGQSSLVQYLAWLLTNLCGHRRTGGAGRAGHLYFSVYLGGEGGDSVGGKVCVVFPLCCGAQEVCQ